MFRVRIWLLLLKDHLVRINLSGCDSEIILLRLGERANETYLIPSFIFPLCPSMASSTYFEAKPKSLENFVS